MQYLILTGMSGAGKTVAIRYLEDLGALCVDNLPPMMLVPFMEACQNTNLHKPMIAIAADVRSGEFFDAKAVTRMIDEARLVGFHIDTLFFEASDEVLINRYKETRREHPLSSEGFSLEEAIREERSRLQPLKEAANHLFDTSNLRPRALQKMLSEIVLHPNYINEGKHRLVIAIGCTGGAHRSVAIAEYVAAELQKLGYGVNVNHRDIALEQAHWAARSEYQKGEP